MLIFGNLITAAAAAAAAASIIIHVAFFLLLQGKFLVVVISGDSPDTSLPTHVPDRHDNAWVSLEIHAYMLYFPRRFYFRHRP